MSFKLSKKNTFTILTLVSALAVIYALSSSYKMYFSDKMPNTGVFNAQETATPQNLSLSVPQLKIYSNPDLKIKKQIPSETKSENLNLTQDVSVETNEISQNYLFQVLSQQQIYFRRCFENYIRENPGQTDKGSLLIEFLVLPHGEIRDVEIKKSDFDNKIFSNCIITVFKRTPIKKFEGNKFLISFPLEFE